jgi:hypothetical protein
MGFLILLLVVLAISAAAPFFGRDSRGLDDHPAEVRWERLPR